MNNVVRRIVLPFCRYGDPSGPTNGAGMVGLVIAPIGTVPGPFRLIGSDCACLHEGITDAPASDRGFVP